MSIDIRPLRESDDLQALTDLLHTAYATLMAQGWNFTAATQSVQTTRERVAAGQAFVAEQAGRLLGTITIGPPKPVQGQYLGDPVPALYTRPDTAILAQLAVHPEARGQGLAERLMDAAEAWAREQGYAQVALDTAEPATALRTRYQRRGYVEQGGVQWAGKRYASVLMSKTLQQEPKR